MLIRRNVEKIGPVQPLNKHCPACHSAHLNRVQRRRVDKLASIFIEIRRYHCDACGWSGNLKAD